MKKNSAERPSGSNSRLTAASIMGLPPEAVKADPKHLHQLLARHLEIMEWLTVPCHEGRKIAEIHALTALSENADDLGHAVVLAQLALQEPHGEFKETADGVYVGTPVRVGRSGVDALFSSVLAIIVSVLSSRESLGYRQQYMRGDVITHEDIARLQRAMGALDAMKPHGLSESGGESAGGRNPAGKVACAPDFSWLRVGTEVFRFTTPSQRSIVKALYDQWEAAGRKDGCGLGLAEVVEQTGASASRLRVSRAFGSNPALGRLVRSAGRGQWALFINKVLLSSSG